MMKLVNTVEALKELLQLAREIQEAEGLPEKDALKRAISELPRLTNDAVQNVRYRPIPKVPTRYGLTPAGLAYLQRRH